MRSSFHHRKRGGFTLIEVAAVLVILGILAAVAVARLTSTASYSVISEAEILKTHFRFAQMKALSDVNATWGIAVAAGSYTLQNNGAEAAIILPGAESATHSFPSGVSSTAQTITFDTWGSPGDADLTLTLSGGGESATITITRNTGFIP